MTLVILLFIVKMGTGLWLMRAGRPINTVLLTVHKLIALLILAMLIWYVYPQLPTAGPAAIAAVAVTGLAFVAAIASGGLVSLPKPASRPVALVHKVTPALVVLGSILAAYLIES